MSKTPKIRLDKKPEIVIFYRLQAFKQESHAPIISFILPEYQTGTRNLLLGRDYCGGDIR
jgi:hypothetical protein